MIIKRPFFVDTIGTLLTSLLTALVTFSTSIIIARYLGPEGKGFITLIMLVINQLGLFLTLGVDISVIHYGGRNRWSIDELASASMGLSILLGLIGIAMAISIFTLAFKQIMPNIYLPLIILLTFNIPFILNMAFLRSLIRVSGRIIEEGILGFLGAIMNLITILTSLILGFGLEGVLFAFWLSTFFISVLTIRLGLRWAIIRGSPSYSLPIWISLVTYGLKLHVGSIFQSLNYRFDMYLVAFYLGNASVGLYSTAVAIGEWLWIIPGILGTVLLQRIATSPEKKANIMMGPVNRFTSGTLLITTIVWAFLGDWLINVLYGEPFTLSYYPLLLLLPGIWTLGLWKNFMNDLSVRGYPSLKSYTSGIALLLTIILDIVLIPEWGISGAAIASTIAYTTAFGVALWFYCRITQFHPFDILIPKKKDFVIVFNKFRSFTKNSRSKYSFYTNISIDHKNKW